ncbi:FAD-binding oxidoreductase [Phanerochaete sordida]|uniref:FAD-binding oxidoreductase n=1 Tax=Phanerochaete sordida TaxID=48140 RepID=A0A9P3GQM9_9APHY|nr:FAD-binding oxidoreductase [Phanerochaete sordida]
MHDLTWLARTVTGDIITPTDDGYDTALDRWARNAVRRARVVVYVHTPADVGAALRYARENGLRLAIHGGGHSPSGASSVEDGLVIDLSRYLDGVRVDPEERLAYVGGGAKWAAVNKATMEHGLAMTGGTVGHTGVAGVTLGGGNGWLTPAHGLTIDHLVRATVVSADSVARTCSAAEHADLFWGLRGGGCNFGVVTEFVFHLHPQEKTVFGGMVVYAPEKLEAIAQEIEQWFPTAGPKEAVHVFPGRAMSGEAAVTLFMFYNGPESEGRERFKAFTDLGPVSDGRDEMTYEAFNGILDEWASPGKCNWTRGYIVDRATKALSRTLFERIVTLGDPAAPFWVSLGFEYMSQAAVNAVPSDATAYTRNRPGLGNAIGLVRWDGARPELEPRAKEILEELAGLVKFPGLRYGNYSADSSASKDEVRRIRAKELYQENYARLQQLKRKYDPEMVFDKWYVIHPAEVEEDEPRRN